MDRRHKPSNILPPGEKLPAATVDIDEKRQTVSATLPNGDTVEVLLYGATVTSWKNGGGKTENVWVSEKAIWDGSKPVRGGIPIVFPNFGPPIKDHATSALPQHGFARNVRWEFLGSEKSESGTSSVKLDFGLYSSALPAKFREAWPLDFGLVYSVTLSEEGLRTIMTVRNEGSSAFEFQFLLHTYLRVNDISQTTINGLGSETYIDKVLNATKHEQTTPSLSITGEVDRAYIGVKQDTTSVLEGGSPRFDVIRDNLSDTVVWNPWIEKAKGMGDFAPQDGYKNMLCVEVGAIDGWQKLEGGDAWEGGQLIKSLL
ncbi:galactose mutarotase-like protein [Trichodelitschia bisporula]|uniref:Glucose-6-phosphate 1-epimerase n=1 Tax=Trichodelitschia bisporula TaxID=703511 RepID=A0A6G1HRY2_9PEZI|nr:galactose mutarotase-like protein [Trichodelitschia bisporula]